MAEKPIAVVVDESKPFLMYLSILLNRMNLEVMPVANAAEALEISRVTRPQLITMDMALPDMAGLEALHAIRKDDVLAETSVIMISSCTDKNMRWEALSLGCIDVLDKPVELRRLHRAVQRCDLYPGGRRRYLRVAFEEPVDLKSQEKTHKVASSTLSERGIFLYTRDPIPKGGHVDVELPLPSGDKLKVGGTVIYVKAENGGSSVIRQGIAVKFDRMTYKDSEVLSSLVTELLIGDIIAEQTEQVVQPKA